MEGNFILMYDNSQFIMGVNRLIRTSVVNIFKKKISGYSVVITLYKIINYY